jgi:hypothetical protein
MELIRTEYLRVLHNEVNNLLAVAIRKLLKIEDYDAFQAETFRRFDDGDFNLPEELPSKPPKCEPLDARSQMLHFCVFMQITVDKLPADDRRILGRVSDETLKNDFKQLGIRSRQAGVSLNAGSGWTRTKS